MSPCDRGPGFALGLVALLLGLLSPLSARAEGSPSVPRLALTGEAPVSLPLWLWEDPEGTRTFQEIRAQAAGLPFRHPEGRAFNAGFTRSAFWLRFTLANETAATGRWVMELPPTTDHATLYTVDALGQVREQRSGKGLPFVARDLQVSNLGFMLELGPAEVREAYLRVASRDNLSVGAVVRGEWRFAEKVANERLFSGLYFGVLLAMVAYSLFVFVATRDRASLWYVLFELAMALMLASQDQLTSQFLWPRAAGWGEHSEVFFAGLTLVGGLGFAREFLGRQHLSLWMARGLEVGMVSGALLALGALLWFQPWMWEVGCYQVLAVCVFAHVLGLWAWRRGSENAPFFVAGWLMILLSGVVAALSSLGSLPSVVLATGALKAGSAAEALLFTFALAQRLKRMEREKRRAQDALLAGQAAYAARLEGDVQERTRALSTALAEVRSAQAKLVQQARLASLGHLIAGVAHEVGNPLNFIQGGAAEASLRLTRADQELSALSDAGTGADLPARERLLRVHAEVGAVRQGLELVTRGAGRIHGVLQNLRSYMSGKPVESREADLVAALESTLGLFRAQFDRQGIRLVRALEPLPPLRARPGELAQVFTNLLLNSCAAMPEGGTITVSSRVVEGQVELRFGDTGPGVPPEHRGAIFDPFFTTRAPGEGVGLGLSICSEIVQRHHGELQLADDGPGATFVVRLPLEGDSGGGAAAA